VHPRSITVTATHAYESARTYVFTVTVEDDDGGSTAVTELVAV